MSGLEFRKAVFRRVSLPQESAQNSVHETGLGPIARALGHLDGLVNGGMVGDAIKPENLIEPQAQQILQARFLRPALSFKGDEPVERGLPAHDAEDEFMA